MTENAAQKWFVKRQGVTTRTDEDAAMAYKSEGPYTTQDLAHIALAEMIEREIAGWKRMDMDASRDQRALNRVLAGETDVTEENVRWFIVEITGNPAAPEVALAAPAGLASHMVEMAASAGLSPAEAETITANELADAIERGDKRAADYHRATLDEIAKIKKIVIALGGHWR